MNPVFAWLDARANPIAVKEVYQGFRSRAFMFGCSAALAISLISYMLIVANTSSSTPTDMTFLAYYNQSMGLKLYNTLLSIIGIMATIVIPYISGTQLRDEIVSSTMELLFITNLSTWQIISGRFQAATIKMILLFSYMGPFAFVAFLLGGVDAFQILLSLAGLFIIGLLISAANLVINAVVIYNNRYKIWSILGQIVPVIFLLFLGPLVLGLFGFSRRSVVSTFSFDAWPTFFFYFLLMLLATALLLRIATDMLTAPASRNYVVSKILMASIVIIESIPVLLDHIFPAWGIRERNYEASMAISLMSVTAMSLFWSGFKFKMPKNPWQILFADGYLPTMVLCTAVWYYLMFAHDISRYQFNKMSEFYLSILAITAGAQVLRRVLPVRNDSVIAYVAIALLLWVLWIFYDSI